MSENKQFRKTVEWRIHIPIFRNRPVRKQLETAIGLPFRMLLLVLFSNGTFTKSLDTIYILGLVSSALLLIALNAMLVFRRTYDVHFVVNDEGVLYESQQVQPKNDSPTSEITFMGTGLLSRARQSALLEWSEVKSVEYLPEKKTILLRGGFARKMAVFCTDQNYKEVEAFIAGKVG